MAAEGAREKERCMGAVECFGDAILRGPRC